MSARIALLEAHDRILRDHFRSHPQGHEGAAVVLFRRIPASVKGLAPSDRYISVEVHAFPAEWITSSSENHVAFSLRHLREFFRRAKDEGLVFGFAHNHPTGFPEFSEVDGRNEETLLAAITNRNGRQASLVALLLANGAWSARTRSGSSPAANARHVLVPGRPLQIHVRSSEGVPEEYLARQLAAFGRAFVQKLGSLRIGVVGAGGTGSPLATMLARSGIGEIVIIDPDHLEESNLNRVRGARTDDVGRNKAEILAEYLGKLGLPTLCAPMASLVDSDPAAVDALAGCDVIFGCTDDQIGREILNTAAYVYALPYIDLGLGGKVVETDGIPSLRYHHGRVSTILPEQGECLLCQGVLRPAWIQREYALRRDPTMSVEEARQRYLEGAADEAPGVGPFTSAVADFAAATLYDLVAPFRRFPAEVRWDAYSIDFVKMSIRSKAAQGNDRCPFCGIRDYLVLPESARLQRPALGRRDVAY